MSKEYSSTITIAFPSNKEAEIIKSVLDVDDELQPQRLSRTLTVEGNELIIFVEAVDLKMLRIGVSSIFDMATVAVKTLLEFS